MDLVDRANDWFYSITPTGPCYEQLRLIDFDSTSMIENAGSFLWFYWAIASLFIVYGILWFILKCDDSIIGVDKLAALINRQVMFAGPIELLKIGQYGLLMGAMINVFYSTNMTASDAFSLFISNVLLATYIVLPFAMLLVFIYYDSREARLQEERYLAKFRVLSAGLRDESILSMVYPFVFLMRRYFLIVLFLNIETYNKLIWFGMVQMLIVIYHIVAKPFNQTITNGGVLARERFFLTFAYFIPTFTDYVADPYMRHVCGSIIICFFLTMVGISVLATSIFALIRLKLMIRHFIVNKKKYTLKRLVLGER